MIDERIEDAAKQNISKATVWLPAERFGGNAGRPLVAADRSRHDAAGLSQLQGIHAVLRRDCNQYPRGSPAEADGIRNHRIGTGPLGWTQADLFPDREGNRSGSRAHGNGVVGRRARRYRQSGARPANARRQKEIPDRNTPTLGRPTLTPNLISLGYPFQFASGNMVRCRLGFPSQAKSTFFAPRTSANSPGSFTDFPRAREDSRVYTARTPSPSGSPKTIRKPQSSATAPHFCANSTPIRMANPNRGLW